MNLSYWEKKSLLTNIDFTVVGSGIVGLTCALVLKERFPKADILILERGWQPQGASTKNAGFACFGSLSEILDDLKSQSEAQVFDLVKKRHDGLVLLRQILSDEAIGFRQFGGHELFTKADKATYDECLSQKEHINKLLFPLFGHKVFSFKENKYGFKNIEKKYCYTPFEGQIDTGKMMASLINLVLSKGVKILNTISVEYFEETKSSVFIQTNRFEFESKKLFIATNGFAQQLIDEAVKPARAQVLITKPIDGLHIKGTFHMDKGFYYFRNVDNRILFGGGRNLDFKGEETTQMGQTDIIQNRLEELLRTVILPETMFEIDHRWSGIMGVGSHKSPIVKPISQHVFCGVRMGGMGIAIGSLVGKELAQMID
ncbi:MAG TPA: FAD-dependent oxidoreductase [Aquaticitalea sp.]|nr:FAD-dependent oxidoreductase [Aquaticitalea sp.]